MFYIGIDPGKDGALAWISDSGEINVTPFDRASYSTALYLMKKNARVILERAASRPGQGVASMFSFGENYGFIQGLLEANCIPYETVHPQKWKKEFSVTSDKNTSIKVAKRMFPGVELKKSKRCTKDHDGMAEALLMAEYARRHLK